MHTLPFELTPVLNVRERNLLYGTILPSVELPSYVAYYRQSGTEHSGAKNKLRSSLNSQQTRMDQNGLTFFFIRMRTLNSEYFFFDFLDSIELKNCISYSKFSIVQLTCTVLSQ